MRLRKLIFRTLVLAAVIAWFTIGGIPVLVLMFKKDDIVSSLKRGGFDVSECEKRKLSVRYPTAGVPECLEQSFKDIDRRFEQELRRVEEMQNEAEGD